MNDMNIGYRATPPSGSATRIWVREVRDSADRRYPPPVPRRPTPKPFPTPPRGVR
jgi:hypothetical protein